MINVEKEVPSLELCKKLKELGFPQEGGGWYWVKDTNSSSPRLTFMNELLQEMSPFVEEIKAPTCRELGEWLPDTFTLSFDIEFLSDAQMVKDFTD